MNAAPPLVDVLTLVADAVLDVRYASTANFLGEPLYPFAAVLLAEPTARKLAAAASRLRAEGFRLKLFDGYRPLSVQRRMWEKLPDLRFVADPLKGSGHNRGAAVDAALVRPDGSALEQPSDFDDFSPLARHGQGSPAALAHSRRLRAAMESAGFRALDEEWWHYRDPDGDSWPLLDVPFDRLRR